VIAVVLALTAAANLAYGMIPGAQGDLPRMLVLAAVAAAALLGYFRLFAKAFSPALAEARLQALQARIRPHFLFNSLNAVLALIRRDPKRAERTLEDLADLVVDTPERHRIPRRPGADQGATFGPLDQIGRDRLDPLGRVREREDQGPLDALGQLADDRLGERPACRRGTDHDRRMDLRDDIGEADRSRVAPARHVGRGPRVDLLEIA